jgi:hypothetical protein
LAKRRPARLRPFARAIVCLDENYVRAHLKVMTVAMSTTRSIAPKTASRLRIDFLFLDLATCTRCRGTDQNLESALEAVREVLKATGTEVEVNKTQVKSAEQARELRFLSSPTIRVNGRDVAFELRESPCDSPCCADGRGEPIACRVWVHEGREYTEPPVALFVDGILREAYAGTDVNAEPEAEPYELPENLERFFAGRIGTQTAAAPGEAACCPPAEQRSCCEPEDKAECCGAASREGCGCR